VELRRRRATNDDSKEGIMLPGLLHATAITEIKTSEFVVTDTTRQMKVLGYLAVSGQAVR
jgi:hypothetical protein